MKGRQLCSRAGERRHIGERELEWGKGSAKGTEKKKKKKKAHFSDSPHFVLF